MSEQPKKEKKGWEIVFKSFQNMSIFIGILIYIIVFLIKFLCTEENLKEKFDNGDIVTILTFIFNFLAEMFNVVGGAILSIGLVNIFYQKWKDKEDNTSKQLEKAVFRKMVKKFYKKWTEQQENDQYFLLGSQSYSGSSDELQKIANIDKNSSKILLIGRITEDPIKQEYAYTTLLNEKFELLRKDIPMLSYGTTFQFLNKDIVKFQEYYKAFKSAIERGLGLNVSIVYPSKKVVDFGDIDGTTTITDATTTIENFKNLISLFIKERTNLTSPIELRLSKYLSPCSFSSFEFKDGRTIRTLEFNFIHEDDRLSQIHDNPSESKIKESKGEKHLKFSSYLFNRYNRLYKESFLALRYPMLEDITYYVLGIIRDFPDDSIKKHEYAIQRKFTIMKKNELYKTVVSFVENNENFKLSPKANNITTPVLENTIIGNVLSDYETQTKFKITPIKSFEINADTFLLLVNIDKSPKTINEMIVDNVKKEEIMQIEEFAQEDGETNNRLEAKLRDVGCNISIINRIKTIIKTF